MPRTIAVYPSQRTHRQTVTLDGVKFQLRLQWVRRVRGWYLSLFTLAGEPIIEGQRLSAEAPPLLGYRFELGPAGQLWVRGADQYHRRQLGERIHLRYLTAAEVPAPTVSPTSGLIITLQG